MVVLLGQFSSGKSNAWRYVVDNGWGRMWVSYGPWQDYEGEPVGLDNGAFGAYRRGVKWNERPLLRLVERTIKRGITPTVCVVPDIVEGGNRSLELSVKWRDRLPVSWPWLLAVQDGHTVDQVDAVLPRFSGLFLGGSREFKNTAARWARLAHGRGKWFHYARCGTVAAMRHARQVEADSVDSTGPVMRAAEGKHSQIRAYVKEWAGQNPQKEIF